MLFLFHLGRSGHRNVTATEVTWRAFDTPVCRDRRALPIWACLLWRMGLERAREQMQVNYSVHKASNREYKTHGDEHGIVVGDR
jgi:hypothetical protein